MKTWNPHYKSLDHWRGLAALWVMMFHGFATSYDKSLHPLGEILKFIAKPGWLGVHIFFVISGYCITASAYKLIQKNQTPWDFLKNRFLRLFPVYWLAFLVAIAINLVASLFNQTTIGDNLPDTWQTWLGNILLIQPYLDMPSYVVVYWSLVVELAFYLVVTVLLLIGNLRRYKIAIFIAITLAFISPFIVSNRVQFIQFWGEFVCGLLLFMSLLYHNQNNIHKKKLSLFLIISLTLLGTYLAWIQNIHNQLWFSGIFSLILYILYVIDSKICENALLKSLHSAGIMSYSLYLLHVPFQGRVINLGMRFMEVNSLEFLGLQILGWIVAILVSYNFYKFIEKPLNDWRSQVSNSSLKVFTNKI